MEEKLRVAIEQPSRTVQTGAEPQQQQQQQQLPVVEQLQIDDAERQAPKRWRPYEDSKYESPVLNRFLFPCPQYYYCRWKILNIFHTRLLFGVGLGQVLVFVLLIGGLAAALGVIGLPGPRRGTGATPKQGKQTGASAKQDRGFGAIAKADEATEAIANHYKIIEAIANQGNGGKGTGSEGKGRGTGTKANQGKRTEAFTKKLKLSQTIANEGKASEAIANQVKETKAKANENKGAEAQGNQGNETESPARRRRGRGKCRASGDIANIPLALAFAFACRNSLWVLFTGLPFERALFWHKLCAYVSVLVGAWHGYVCGRWDVSGLVLTAAMAALGLFSLWFFRRKFFEAFYRFHWILSLLVIAAALWHDAGAIFWGVGLWLLDIVLRALIALTNYRKRRKILAVRLPSNVIRLTFPKGDFKYKSGQYCFICVPGVSWLEWHPFSLSSSPHEDTVSMHVRVLGDWSKKLYDYVKETKRITVFLDGPYGAPSVDLDGYRYKMFMFVSGGIGITPMQSICNDILHQRKRGRDIRKVMFIWSVRDLFMVTSVLDYDQECFHQNTEHRLPFSFIPDLLARDEPTEVMENHFYLTRERNPSRFDEAHIRPEMQPDLKFGRPDLPKLMSKMKDYATEQGERRVAVLSCGPSALVDNMEKLCSKYSSGGVTFDFHKEVFEF